MSVVGDIRAGLRENIKANVQGWQVSRYRLSAPTPPGIQIVRGSIRSHLSHISGATEYDFRVQAFVAHTDDINTQAPLDELFDVMTAAIESDRTLGGACSDLIVRDIPEEQILVTADNRGLVIAEWLVTVLVGNT